MIHATPLADHLLTTALIATLVIVIALDILTKRHHERRLQDIEHEIADLRASLNLPATTPEVIRRYDTIQDAAA